MRRKIPSLQALACFDAAARHESFTRAAQELALTQGAVSRQITALEEFLGMDLFRRTRHGVAITERGIAYAKQIAPRLQGLEQDTLDAMSTQGQGSAVHLAAVPTFATRWLIPRLPRLAALHPDITVHIETRTRPFMFGETQFDAALFAGTPEQVRNWAGTKATLLLMEEVVPVCSPKLMGHLSELTPQAIALLPLLQQSTRAEGWRQWFEAQGVNLQSVGMPLALAGPRYELFSMTAAAATQGMGVALVPRLLVETELARGELVIACDQPLRGERGYYIVTPQRNDKSAEQAALSTFVEWLKTQKSAMLN